MGYHKRVIERGVYGEVSKILEEVLELQDANEQGICIMELVELADIVGSIQGYLNTHHPSIGMIDLMQMSDATRRAFEDGSRTEPVIL